MATIIQVESLGEVKEVVCTTVEEWWMIDQDECNSVIVDKEPTFKVGSLIEIACGENGQSAFVPRTVKCIEKEADQKWIITFNNKGEKRKKVSIITIRLNQDEVEQLEAFKKMIGKKTASEAFKYMMKEFPRWNEVTKESFQKCREQEEKYNKLLKANTDFMLAFQEMVKAVNEQ